MKLRLLGLTVVVAALAAVPAHAVSGGTTLPIAQAPYVAWLSGQCTGTLISPTRILTAAHCLDGNDAADARVLVGVDGNTIHSGVRKFAVPVGTRSTRSSRKPFRSRTSGRRTRSPSMTSG